MISLDAVTHGKGLGGGVAIVHVTANQPNRALLMAIGWDNPAAVTPSNVDYNGIPARLLGRRRGTAVGLDLYVVPAPTVGSHQANFTLNFPFANYVVGISTWYGVHQEYPVINTQTTAGSGTPAKSKIGLVAGLGQKAVDAIAVAMAPTLTITEQAGQTALWNETQGTFLIGAGSVRDAVDGGNLSGWDESLAAEWVAAACVLRQAVNSLVGTSSPAFDVLAEGAATFTTAADRLVPDLDGRVNSILGRA